MSAIIHEAITRNPDPTKFLPIEVNSAFPEGAKSALTSQEKAKIDKFIEAVPDKNDPVAINYWVKMGDRDVYLEGWCDKCLAGTGFPPMAGGDWDEKIEYMVRDTKRTLIAKQTDGTLSPAYIAAKLPLTLIEGGFREFEAGEKANLYGVSWGVYVKPEAQGNPGNLEVEIPKTRVSSLGFVELELPVARAVEALAEERTVSSGFHEKLNQRWTIVFWDIVRPKVAMAAKKAGLEVSYREEPKGTGHYLTDISLPNVGKEEIEKATAVFNRFAELYERGNPQKESPEMRGGVMEETLAERIAERAAVGTANLLGSHIAKEVAKQQEEALHGSPITERGRVRLGEPPLCYDFRGTRSWVLVRSWQRMEKEHLPTLPVGESWSEVRRVCAMSPEMVEAKKPELCSLTHMEQVPACARYVARERVPVGVR